MTPLALTFKSLRHRRLTVGLTVLSIGLSTALLLSVERIRREARESFTSTVSGTDLIVGARTGPVQLLLSSVFRLGDASNNIHWKSYEAISAHPAVAWSIPVSLGDSYKGYRVLGTTPAYFEHLRYGKKQPLKLQAGSWFTSDNEAVLGSEAAARLNHHIGDRVVISHGTGEISFIEHAEHPFTVIGILAPTGTPVDRTVHISLEGMDSLHADFNHTSDGKGLDPLAAALAAAEKHVHDETCRHTPDQITAFFLGLKSRPAVLGVQRMVNAFPGEPLTAALPALALQELWGMVGVVERALLAVSALVVLVGLAGMLVAIMTGLNERRREMAILRSVGARPVHILGLIIGEAALVTAAGVVLGYLLLQGGLLLANPFAEARFGLMLQPGWPTPFELLLGGIILIAGLLTGLLPAWRSYRYSLADGLTVKV